MRKAAILKDNMHSSLSSVLEKLIALSRYSIDSPQMNFVNIVLDIVSLAEKLFIESLELGTLWLLKGYDDCFQEVESSSTHIQINSIVAHFMQRYGIYITLLA